MNASGWLDDFLFWDAMIVSALVFVDWLLGSEKRANIREKVGEWWLHLDSFSYSGLVADDARRVRTWIEHWFGPKAMSIRFAQRAFLFSACSTLVCVALLWGGLVYLIDFSEGHTDHTWGELLEGLIVTPFSYSLPLVTPGFLATWLSISATLFLLKIMEKSTSMLRLIGITLFDLCVAMLLTVASYIMTIEVVIRDIPRDPIMFLAMLPLLMGFAVIALFTALPTLIHAGLSFAFILSKGISPLLKKPSEILLLRFYESGKGILTQIAVGIGATAKITQEVVKYIAA